jgi:hypothetical protein
MLYLAARSVAAVLGVALASGCGLISSDVTDFALSLPPRKFTIDATGWQVDTKAGTLFGSDGKLAPVSCNSMPSMCGAAVATACSMGCSGACNSMTNSCELTLDVSRSQMVDLVSEQPELKSVNDQSVIKVSIDSVTYRVDSNSLTVATPAIDLYVAPLSVLAPGDAQAKLIGTIPGVPAGMTTGDMPVAFTATGKADLIKIMSQFKVPFNVLEGSKILVTAGQALPTGKLEAVVNITGHAGL